MLAAVLPAPYHPELPIASQRSSWKCGVAALRWCLSAYGWSVNPDWLTDELLRADLIVPRVGMRDKTGRDLSAFVNALFGRKGFSADYLPDAPYEWAHLAARGGPAILYGETWRHWTAVRAPIPNLPALHLANPNAGYNGIAQVLPARCWPLLGPLHLTVIRRRTTW